MRRSKEIQLTLVASLALSIIGCEHRDCVDSQNRLLPDSACRTSSGATGAHYLYGGSSGGRVGDTVIGGSVSRGGFGATGEAGGE